MVEAKGRKRKNIFIGISVFIFLDLLLPAYRYSLIVQSSPIKTIHDNLKSNNKKTVHPHTL